MPINDARINHRPIEFSNYASKNWDVFLSEKKKEKKYHDIENTLEQTIEQLDELWVVQQHGNLEYSLEKSLNFRPNAYR